MGDVRQRDPWWESLDQAGGGNSEEELEYQPALFFFSPPHYRIFQIERVEILIRETIHRETVSL